MGVSTVCAATTEERREVRVAFQNAKQTSQENPSVDTSTFRTLSSPNTLP